MDDDGDRTALGTYSASWLGDSCKQRWDSIKVITYLYDFSVSDFK